mmetsp:Transcript_28717/g.46494  ORF Transcript_28717/g.46494 Transcript_28717/m.46494 type:complete len:325 (+) Transcript_28717:210-1184(+)|eukprot:CAMPEP_0184647026 /NCGR_PEP_ID=MMETSP0308-20130426/3878_1 /TAXON_ID=38269 /ORGANISM="Gloeochaete witrockiana, Strain SAG 46.84" /LENGTH=324 /DNA_ID=CAMNT_0027077635 /DNA_START=191 /DNA_END=1165 /DNA_ORIENTATION=-
MLRSEGEDIEVIDGGAGVPKPFRRLSASVASPFPLSDAAQPSNRSSTSSKGKKPLFGFFSPKDNTSDKELSAGEREPDSVTSVEEFNDGGVVEFNRRNNEVVVADVDTPVQNSPILKTVPAPRVVSSSRSVVWHVEKSYYAANSAENPPDDSEPSAATWIEDHHVVSSSPPSPPHSNSISTRTSHHTTNTSFPKIAPPLDSDDEDYEEELTRIPIPHSSVISSDAITPTEDEHEVSTGSANYVISATSPESSLISPMLSDSSSSSQLHGLHREDSGLESLLKSIREDSKTPTRLHPRRSSVPSQLEEDFDDWYEEANKLVGAVK